LFDPAAYRPVQGPKLEEEIDVTFTLRIWQLLTFYHFRQLSYNYLI
jgi:hypothetical protein